MNNNPIDPPKCEHGRIDFQKCHECYERDQNIRLKIAPLVDEFWEYRGRRDLSHLLFRAYHMGRRHKNE